MDDVWTTYVGLLSDLRRGPGCTLQRLGEAKYSDIIDALKNRLSSSGNLVRIEDCYEQLRSMGASLDERKIREAFLVGFKFDSRYQADTVHARREAYLHNLDNSMDAESKKLRADIRTLERRENKAIQTIARWLVESRVQGEVDLLTTTPLGDRELQPVRRSSVYFYSDTGALREVNNYIWVRALVSDANPQMPTYYQIFHESRRGVVSIRPRHGCKLISHRESEGGVVEAMLEILTRLSPEDGEYCFSWDAIVHSDRRAAAYVRWKLRPPFTAHMEFHLNFNENCVPIRAWWFNTSDDERAQFEPDESEGRHLPLLDGGRYVYKIFVDEEYGPSPHLGIAYAWE